MLSVYVHMLGGAWDVDGVGRPCAPVRDDIVTPRDLFLSRSFRRHFDFLYYHQHHSSRP